MDGLKIGSEHSGGKCRCQSRCGRRPRNLRNFAVSDHRFHAKVFTHFHLKAISVFTRKRSLFSCDSDQRIEYLSAAVSHPGRSAKGNRRMRRILGQAANAAIKAKASIFQDLYRRLVTRLGHKKAIRAVAHKLCRVLGLVGPSPPRSRRSSATDSRGVPPCFETV